MVSVTDIARAHGAGPIQLSVFELKQRIVRKARDWVDGQDCGCSDSFIRGKEKALLDAVKALEAALESTRQPER